jgi:hypothetical protein
VFSVVHVVLTDGAQELLQEMTELMKLKESNTST